MYTIKCDELFRNGPVTIVKNKISQNRDWNIDICQFYLILKSEEYLLIGRNKLNLLLYYS